MNDIIKEAFKIIGEKFKNSKIFMVALVCLACVCLLISILVVYPSLREGATALSTDVFVSEGPVLKDVTYDAANKVVKGTVAGAGDLSEYRVILFILTDQWYVKPDFDATAEKGMSKLQGNQFIINAFTLDHFDEDTNASRYAVFLVSGTYEGLKHMNDYDGAMEACVDSYTDTIPA